MIRASSLNDNYPQVRLGDVVEFLDHMRKPVTAKDRVAGPYPYYGANGQQDSVEDYIFNEPLVLLAEDGGNFGDPNRTIAYQVEGKCWVNNHAHVLRPTSKIDIRYLCRHLELYDVRSHINGATREKLNKGAAQEIIISLPPLEEQKRIAAILDKADALRRKRQQAIDLTDQLLRSVFLDMFGDPVTNPKGWSTLKLSNVAKFISGGTPRKNSPEFWGGDILWVSPKDMKSLYLENSQDTITDKALVSGKAKLIPKNSVLCVTRSGILKHTFPVGISATSLTINQDLKALIPSEKISPVYLCYFLKMSSDHILSTVRGTTADNLSTDFLKLLDVPLPSIKEQKHFQDLFEKQQSVLKHQRKMHCKSTNFFESLTQQAFSKVGTISDSVIVRMNQHNQSSESS